METYENKADRSLIIFGLIFVLLALAIAIAGYFSYLNFEHNYRAQVENQITAIANLKEDELIDWRNGRLAEAELIRRNQNFARQLQLFLNQPDNSDPLVRPFSFLNSFQAIPEYDRIAVLDLNGQMRMSNTGEIAPLSKSVMARIPQIVQLKQPEMLDFYLRDTDSSIRLAVMVPITAPDTGEVIGLVSLRIDPHVYLFPFLQQWPIPSDSGETLLIRREGDEIVTLNAPRFNPDGALKLRIPMTKSNAPTIMAARGNTGFVEGVDYRNEPVLADIRTLADSPWLLVTKIDTAEALAPLQARLWQTVVFFGTLIFAVGAGLTIVWRQQGLRYYQQQVKIMTALQESQERYRQISAMISDYVYSGLVLPDGSAKSEWTSGAFEIITGYTLEEINRMPGGFPSLILPEDIEKSGIHALSAGNMRQINSEYRIRRKDGEIRWLRDQMQIENHDTGHGIRVLGAVQDITEQKYAEEAVRESERKLGTLLSNLVGFAYRCKNDADWTMEFVSSGCYALTGYAVDDLVGNDTLAYADLIHPADREMVWATVQAGLKNQTPFQMEYRITCREGQEKWVWEQGRGIFTDNTLEALEGYITDITDLKTAQRELIELNRSLEARVKERTIQVQDLYDNAPTGYHSLDNNGTFAMINQTELDWLGYQRDEIIGVKTFGDLLPPDERDIFLTQTFPLFKKQGWIRDLEFSMIRKDGSTLPVLINATAIYDQHGNYFASRSTMFDNTGRKKAENALRESEAQNRFLFEEAPDAVVLLDDAGRLTRMNRAFETLSGYPAAQLIGLTFEEAGLIDPQQQGQFLALVRKQGQNQLFSGEFTLTRANGEHCDAGTRVFKLDFRGRQHYLATIRDITVEKQAAKTLQRANIELARAARAKDDFLANMSHELRTPLNAILNFSESLQENIYGPLNARQQSPIQHIEAAGRHLLALINDILDLSKVEAGQIDLHLETVHVEEVCQASLLFVRELAGRKSLKLSFRLNDHLATMQADHKRLKQILVNLLSNAVKFTPAGGQVGLEVQADAEAGTIRFIVQDTGIGIAPDDMDRLFRPFEQVDSSLSRQFEGSGLGLALVRRLTELHGGSITVESEPGRGSCFTLALPYRLPELFQTELPTPPQFRHRHRPPASLMRTALVIEDSNDSAEHIARYLHEMNLTPVIHLQGKGASQQAINVKPDIIILDLLLPDQSGWEVLAQLKSNPHTRDIPVIIVSVVDEPEKGLAAGAAEYLVKPISRETLRHAINSVAAAQEQPALAHNAGANPAQSGAGLRPTGPKILLAEDSDANILVIDDYLSAKGFQVRVAHDGLEALAFAEKMLPDLILMDIQMPNLDGLEAIRRLRTRPEFETTPIIALTALAMPGDKKRCIDAGANEYITKPAVMQELVHTIERLISKADSG